MGKTLVNCSHCKTPFSRNLQRINEAKKFNWKQFCSSECLAKAKITSITTNCANFNCTKKVSRKLNQYNKSKLGNIFCSSICAATHNNLTKRIYKMCPLCAKKFYGNHVYCSVACYDVAPNPRKIPTEKYKKKIISQIIKFHKEHKRIPFKQEMYGIYGATRRVFETWNKAIKEAGFKPNPVKFAKAHIAKDGHRCDSLAEKIIDDWLFARNIKHERSIFYPNSRYTVDFYISGTFIEFFGLQGELEKYDKNVKAKEKIAIQNNIELIKIYPKDLFPKNNLSNILKF